MVQFGKNSSNEMERFTVYQFWHNYEKPFRINKKGRIYRTHAEAAGVEIEKYEQPMKDVFKVRYDYLFVENKLNKFMKSVWNRTILTPRVT